MILITGGTGFLGRFLVHEFLQAGYALRLLVRNAHHPALQKLPPSVDIVEGDLLDVPSLWYATEGVKGIIHAGAMVSFQKKDRPVMKRINEEGTANLVNVSLERSVAKLVNVSSVSALGRTGSNQLMSEKNVWKESPLNAYYGKTKYLAEKQIFRAAEEGLPVVQCLPTLILGAGDWQFGPPKLFNQIARGYPFCPAGTNGWVGAEDVARACRLLFESNFKNGERFIACSENLSYQKVFELIAKSVGVKAPSIKVSPAMGTWLGITSEWLSGLIQQPALITEETARTAGSILQYDSSLFQNSFSFKFEPIREVIPRIAEMWRKEKKLKR